MMQPILLSTSSTPQVSERLSESATVDNQTQNSESLLQEGKFSQLLDSVMDLTGKGESKLAGKELTPSAELLPDLTINDSDMAASVDASVLTSSVQDNQKVAQSSSEDELLLEDGGIEHFDLNEIANDPQPPSILAQIEAAQKADTKISDSSNSGQVEASQIGEGAIINGAQPTAPNTEEGKIVSSEQAKVSLTQASKATNSVQAEVSLAGKDNLIGEGAIINGAQPTASDTEEGKIINSKQAKASLTQGSEAASNVQAEFSLTGEDKTIKTGNRDSLISSQGEAIKANPLITAKSKENESPNSDPFLMTIEKEAKGGATSFENPQQMMDKQNELFFANNNEMEKNAPSHSIDNNILRSAEVNSGSLNNLSKLVNQHSPHSSTLAGLQQPIDMHEKNASVVLGERVLMMINQGNKEVSIRLDPAELGSLHIKLQMHQDKLHVAIQAEVGQSRDLIEQNLPKLREQLAQQGVSLGQTSVEQQTAGQQQNANQQGKSAMQNTATAFANESASQGVEEEIVFSELKIPLSAQGIDSYA